MISYRTTLPARTGAVPVLGVDTEHCLFAAHGGVQPIHVILSLGLRWPVTKLATWDDARLAVRVVGRRLNPRWRIR